MNYTDSANREGATYTSVCRIGGEIKNAASWRFALWGTIAAFGFVCTVAEAITLTAVNSRKAHGSNNYGIAVDTAQNISGAITVDSRAIGTGHQIVFQFDVPVTNIGIPAAFDESGNSVGTLTPLIVGNDVVLTLTGVPDNKRVTIILPAVNGVDFQASLGFLVGDVNNSRSVTAIEVQQVKARSGHTADETNFRFDVNASGTISAADILSVRTRVGRALPVATVYSLVIGTSGTGLGTVIANPNANFYIGNSVVTLTATPNPGSLFAFWVGACSGINSTCLLSMNSNKAVTANFNAVSAGPYMLNTSTAGTGAGSIGANPPGPTYAPGTVVTLTAAPDSNSLFSSWSGACTGVLPTCALTMNTDLSASASFGPGTVQEVTSPVGSAGGTITVTNPVSAIAGTRVIVPPQAFSAASTLTISNIQNSSLVPPGIPAIQIDVFPSAALASPATIEIPYTRAALLAWGVTDETQQSVFSFNETTLLWEKLPSTVDTIRKVVITQTPHFSLFALSPLYGGLVFTILDSLQPRNLRPLKLFPNSPKPARTGFYAPADRTPPTCGADQRNVLLIHGVFSSSDQFEGPDDLIAYAKSKYHNVVFYNYPSGRSIEENAQDLAQRIAANDKGFFPDWTNFDIIAHSMGGLVARTLIEKHAVLLSARNIEVKNLITLGTPHEGARPLFVVSALSAIPLALTTPLPGSISSRLYDLLNVRGLTDMAPGSDFINTLNSGPTPAGSASYYTAAGNIGPSYGLVDPLTGDQFFMVNDEPFDKMVPVSSASAGLNMGSHLKGNQVFLGLDHSALHTGMLSAANGVAAQINDWLHTVNQIIYTAITPPMPWAGSKVQLQALASDVASNGTEVPTVFQWASDNNSAATVDAATGMVEAVGPGTACITAVPTVAIAQDPGGTPAYTQQMATAGTRVTTQRLQVLKGGTRAGTVTSAPVALNCGPTCDKNYFKGSLVTLTATPEAGASFTGWSGACIGTVPQCTVTMNTNKTVTANFDQTIQLTVGTTNTVGGSGTVISDDGKIDCKLPSSANTNCSAQYFAGTTVTLTAIPDSTAMLSEFSGWAGAACSGTRPCVMTFSTGTPVVAVTANFAIHTGPTLTFIGDDLFNLYRQINTTAVPYIDVGGRPSTDPANRFPPYSNSISRNVTAPFGALGASASQTSYGSANSIVAIGASAFSQQMNGTLCAQYSPLPAVESQSRVVSTFTLDLRSAYRITGTVMHRNSANIVNQWLASSAVTIELIGLSVGSTTNLRLDYSKDPYFDPAYQATELVSQSGILEPGQYYFGAAALSDNYYNNFCRSAFAEASFSVVFELVPTVVP